MKSPSKAISSTFSRSSTFRALLQFDVPDSATLRTHLVSFAWPFSSLRLSFNFHWLAQRGRARITFSSQLWSASRRLQLSSLSCPSGAFISACLTRSTLSQPWTYNLQSICFVCALPLVLHRTQRSGEVAGRQPNFDRSFLTHPCRSGHKNCTNRFIQLPCTHFAVCVWVFFVASPCILLESRPR